MSNRMPQYQREGRKMLERIRDQSGTLLAVQITACGSRHRKVLEHLIARDLAEIVDHPAVVDRPSGRPAAAIAITEAGKRMLEAPSDAPGNR